MMNTKLEAAAQQALENAQPSVMAPEWTFVRSEDIDALSEALAEQATEPDWKSEATALRVNEQNLEARLAAEPVTTVRSDAVNLARNMLEVRDCKGITPHGVRVLCEAVMQMHEHSAQQAAELVDGALDRTLNERDDAEDFIDALLDEVLGSSRPEWSSAYGRSDALNDVRERLAQHPPAPLHADRARFIIAHLCNTFPELAHCHPARQRQAAEPVALQPDLAATLHPELYRETWNIRHPDMPAPTQQPVLVRDLAEILGATVPEVCDALAECGGPRRSINMAVSGVEALAVAAQLKQAAEPVAWGLGNTAITGSNRWMMLREQVPADDQYGGAMWTPLYTHPAPTQQPLTDEQKLMCWSRATHDADVEHKTEHQCLIDYGREIEAAHNITGSKT